jgi:hypothetical protein
MEKFRNEGKEIKHTGIPASKEKEFKRPLKDYLSAKNDQEFKEFINKVGSGIERENIKTEVLNFLTLHRDTQYWTNTVRENVESVFQNLLTLQNLVKSKNPNAKLIITYVPLGNNFDSLETEYSSWNIPGNVVITSQFNNYLNIQAQKHSIEFADLYSYLAAYKQTPESKNLYLKYDGHLNLNGHRVLANFVNTLIK